MLGEMIYLFCDDLCVFFVAADTKDLLSIDVQQLRNLTRICFQELQQQRWTKISACFSTTEALLQNAIS